MYEGSKCIIATCHNMRMTEPDKSKPSKGYLMRDEESVGKTFFFDSKPSSRFCFCHKQEFEKLDAKGKKLMELKFIKKPMFKGGE